MGTRAGRHGRRVEEFALATGDWRLATSRVAASAARLQSTNQRIGVDVELMTATPILHHYPSSLFSEKVRLALGLREIPWRSVEISNVMPRPDLMPLTGGYRKTPVLQIGADIYCDTQCILPALDALEASGPRLFPYSGLEWPIVRWADTHFFQSSVGVVFGGLPDGALPRAFIEDREALSGRPFDLEALRQLSPHARDQWRAGARWVEKTLGTERDWLLGAEPSAADLAVYMVFWFVDRTSHQDRGDQDASLFAQLPGARSWMQRVEGIGHGRWQEIDSGTALAEASACDPAPVAGTVSATGFRLGQQVSVTPDDYGRVPVRGELMRADDEEIVVRRHDSAAGEISVHFPRVGFRLQNM